MLGMGVAKYAYAYARVRVRLAECLSAGKLRSLAEAKDWSEFFSSLLDSGYKERLARLTPEKADTRTLEIALREDLVAAYEMVLRSVHAKKLRNFFYELFRRLEVKNLKALLRAKMRGFPVDTSSFYPVEGFFKRRISALADAESLDALFNRLNEPYKSVLQAHIASGNILVLEHALDEEIYGAIFERAKQLSAEDERIVHSLVGSEIDIVNIMTILRCKKDGIPAEEVRNLFLLPQFAFKFKQEDARDAIFAENVADAVQSLPEDFKFLEESLAEYEVENSLVPFENALWRNFYEHVRDVLRGYPLNIGTIVGFLYLKEMEIRNIRAIAVCKEHGIPSENVMKMVFF